MSRLSLKLYLILFSQLPDSISGAQEQSQRRGLVVTRQTDYTDKVAEDELEEATTSPENNPESTMTQPVGSAVPQDLDQRSWKSTSAKEGVPINIDELSEKLKSIYPQKSSAAVTGMTAPSTPAVSSIASHEGQLSKAVEGIVPLSTQQSQAVASKPQAQGKIQHVSAQQQLPQSVPGVPQTQSPPAQSQAVAVPSQVSCQPVNVSSQQGGQPGVPVAQASGQSTVPASQPNGQPMVASSQPAPQPVPTPKPQEQPTVMPAQRDIQTSPRGTPIEQQSGQVPQQPGVNAPTVPQTQQHPASEASTVDTAGQHLPTAPTSMGIAGIQQVQPQPQPPPQHQDPANLKGPGVSSGGIPQPTYSGPATGFPHLHSPGLSPVQMQQLHMFSMMQQMMQMSPAYNYQPGYYAHMAPYMQAMSQMAHHMHQLQHQHGGQHSLPPGGHVAYPTFSQYPGWSYPSANAGLPPQSSSQFHESASLPPTSPPKSPTSSRKVLPTDGVSPYASHENLHLAGRTAHKADINELEQALAKTMSRQNAGHTQTHNPSPVNSATQANEAAGESKHTDNVDPGESKPALVQKQSLEKGTSQETSPPVPTHTRSEPDLSGPKVKASRFKVEAVANDPLQQGEESRTPSPERQVEKRGRFQVTKISHEESESSEGQGVSPEAVASFEASTTPNEISSKGDKQLDASTSAENKQDHVSFKATTFCNSLMVELLFLLYDAHQKCLQLLC